MRKNYYLILGISSDATANEVKVAYRRRALELHPDHSGSESGPFLEAQEAYAVLADPDRRRKYDEEMRQLACQRETFASPKSSTFAGRQMSILRSFATFQPSFDEVVDRLLNNFSVRTRPKSERPEGLTVEVILSQEEARKGGVVRLWAPGYVACSFCRGSGDVGGYLCWRCGGIGTREMECPIDVAYPPGIRNLVVQIPLTRLGIRNLYLTVYFRVGTIPV